MEIGKLIKSFLSSFERIISDISDEKFTASSVAEGSYPEMARIMDIDLSIFARNSLTSGN